MVTVTNSDSTATPQTGLCQPLASIVLPTFNGVRFLQQQIDSLFAQDYPNFEIIASDDASTDMTVKLLERYSHHSNFHLLINKQNIGFRKNFALAAKQAKGEIIFPCDQDDVWLPDKVSMLVNSITDNLMVYSNSDLIDENNNRLDISLAESLNVNFISGNNHRAFYFGNCVAAHTLAFRRSLLDYIYPIPDTIFHDHWLAYAAARLGKIKYINKKLVFYRKHSTSVTVANSAPIKRSVSLLEHLRRKAERQESRNQAKIDALMKFAEFNQRTDNVDAQLLDLINELKKFNRYFCNLSVFRILNKNRNAYFSISKKNHFLNAVKESLGKRFYLFFPIT